MKRGHPISTHESDYKTRLSQKDLEIEKMKKVRHRRHACGCSGLTCIMKREKELERVVASQKQEIEAKESQNIPVCQVPHLHPRPPLMYPQKVDEIEEELTCEICAIRMWSPYRCALAHTPRTQWSLKAVLG